MGHTTALSASVTVALCGVLTLGPAAVASPDARTTPSAPAGAATSSAAARTGNAVAAAKDKDREKLASTYRTVTKFGTASQQTGKLAGLAVNGEKDKGKLEEARKDSDKELDNLMAIIPGGSPATTDGRAAAPAPASASASASVRVDLKASVTQIKADTKALVDAALKADNAALTTAAGTLLVHLGQLATTVFTDIGLNTVKDVAPNLPALGQLPTPALPGTAAGTPAIPGTAAGVPSL
ncbi:hypothetical protein ACIQM4_19650 [Streptomyces sp. NPDC091272]|uniref:hypothetical protein n=1 Tax=Streptomyces sp. NPDC091272 TaxID=3365981 RepID=UPI00381E2BB1